MLQQFLHDFFQIVEIAFDFDIILIGAAGFEEVVMVLNPLELVRDDDRTAELTVFEGAGIASP